MNDDYKRLRQTAERIMYRFRDVTDDHAAARSIESDVRNVVEDFEMNKEPRSIDDRVKRIMAALEKLNDGDGQTIDHNDINELIDQYEELREDLRDLDNY